MYRRSVNKVVKGDMVQSAETENFSTTLGLQNVEFFNKFTKLPVVNSAITYASGAYEKAKESSPYIIQRTISSAEDTVKYAAEKTMPLARPMVNKLPVQAVDNLACMTLDKVEEKLPVVTRTPEEIIQNTKDYVNGKLQPTYERVEAVKSTVADATERVLASSVGQMALGGVLTALDTADQCVDYFLPPKQLPKEEIGSENGNATGEVAPPNDHGNERLSYSVNRSVGIAHKVQDRVYGAVAESVSVVRSKGVEFLDAIGISLDMLSSIRDLASPSITMRRLQELYHQLTDEQLPESANTDDLNGKALRLARVLTRQLAVLTQRALSIASAFPGTTLQSIRDQIDVTAVFAAETAAQFMKVTRLEDLSTNALATMKTQLPVAYAAFEKAMDLTVASLNMLFPGLRESIEGSSVGIKARISEAAGEKLPTPALTTDGPETVQQESTVTLRHRGKTQPSAPVASEFEDASPVQNPIEI